MIVKKKPNKDMIIPIAGCDYTIQWDDTIQGACFNMGEKIIKIGQHEKGEMLSYLFHEIFEIILAKRLLRFQKERPVSENGDFLFVFNHDQFESCIADFAYAVSKLACSYFENKNKGAINERPKCCGNTR